MRRALDTPEPRFDRIETGLWLLVLTRFLERTGLHRRNVVQYQDGGTLGLREIQLHANTVGIVEEELRIAGARHNALAEFHVPGLQPVAHALNIAGGKGNMVEAAGVLVFLLGATHHDAFAGFAR